MLEMETSQVFKAWLQRKSFNTEIGIPSTDLRFLHPLTIFLREITCYSKLEIFHVFYQRTPNGLSEVLPDWAQLFVSYTTFQFETQHNTDTPNNHSMTAYQGVRMLEITDMFTPIWSWLMRSIGRMGDPHRQLLQHLVEHYPYGEGERRIHFSGIFLNENDELIFYGGEPNSVIKII